MKALFTLSLVLFSFFAHSADVIIVAPVKFNIATEDAFNKLEESIHRPQGILEKFIPYGVSYRNKVVKDNYFEMVATKRVLLFTRTIDLRGLFNVKEVSSDAEKHCYDVNVDFAQSSPLLSDNFNLLEINFCAVEKSNSDLEITVSPKIYKGNNYDVVLGPVVKNILLDQIAPIIEAVKEDVETK
ncbi:MAG: hypothetical protein AB7I27_13275 [Bacteriovoracaceae bacterium]